MHLPDIQLDAALALLPKESSLNAANALGGGIHAPGGGDSFQKLLEKAMNDARAADKARDDERAARSKDARNRADNIDESRRTDETRRGADRTSAADKTERSEIARHKENAGQAENREVHAEIAESSAQDTETAKRTALPEDAFAEKFRVVTDEGLDELAARKESVHEIAPTDDADEASFIESAEFTEQKTVRGEDTLLLDALAAAEERHKPALETAKAGAENERREEFESKKDSAAKRMETAAVFNARILNANAAVPENADGNSDDAGQTETVGAAKKRGFFEGDKPLFTVIDERTASSREKSTHETAGSEGNRAELQLSLPGAAKDARIAPNDARNVGTESKFTAMLSQEIKNNASEFVKAGSIILRDNDSGSIRLALHPEDLGDVKILLQLTDNNIAARITVATKEAYDAFKSSIDSLKQAFNDSGFSTGDFNLSWTGGGAQGNAQHNHHGQEPSRQAFERASAHYVGGIHDFDGAADESRFAGIDGYAPVRVNAVNIMA